MVLQQDQVGVVEGHQAGLAVRAEGDGGDVGGGREPGQLAEQTEGGEAEADGRVLSVDQLRPGRGEREDGEAVGGEGQHHQDGPLPVLLQIYKVGTF